MNNLKVFLVAVDQLIPYANNSRTHSAAQIDKLTASIKAFGWTNPLLLDGNYGLIAGHGRLLAAKKLGLEQVPAINISGLSEAQKRAYIIADNQLALGSGWDDDILAIELASLKGDDIDLDLLGFDAKELTALLNRTDGTDGLTDEDEVPDPPAEPISRLGDIWQLGEHRLMCGDSTNADNVQKLLCGGKPHLMVTDPPYGVNYDADWRDQAASMGASIGGGRAIGKVMNDDRADWRRPSALA